MILQYPGGFVLYFLFFILLIIGAGVIAIIATCATCCVAAIPYVGQVILLPVTITLHAFTLLFLKQFGSEYDVWGGIEAAPPVPSIEPPPLQA